MEALPVQIALGALLYVDGNVTANLLRRPTDVKPQTCRTPHDAASPERTSS